MAFVYWIHLPEHTDMFSQGYVGITSKSVKTRLAQHKSDAKRSNNKRPLGHAIRKYGDSLVVDTILEGPQEYCQDVEKKLRASVSIGWNLAIGGDSPRIGSTASEESKLKMSKAQLGRKHSEETKAKIAKKSRLFRHTEESKAKMSASQTGKKLSDEHKAKLVAASTGRAFSEETKAKLRPHWDVKTFSQAAKDAALVYLKSLNSWEVHTAKVNKHVWLMADAMHQYVTEFPKHGSKRLAKAFGLKECNVMGILKKLRTDWIPAEDADWLLFKENNKEPNEATPVT